MCTFSIITATYNLVDAGRAEAMRACAESLWVQDCQDYEHIIQDAGSKDGTLDLLEGIARDAPSGIATRIFSESDSGLYEGMNRGAAQARGEYILMLNSDDSLASPHVLSALLKVSRDGRYDFVFGTHIHVNAAGEERHYTRASLSAILQRMPYCHQSLAMKASVFRELGGFDLRYRLAADYDLNLRLAAGGYKGLKIATPIARFRDGGASSDTEGAAKEHALIWQRNYARWLDMEPYDLGECEQWYWKGSIPVRVAWQIFKASDVSPTIRRAAWHSLRKSVRRRLVQRG